MDDNKKFNKTSGCNKILVKTNNPVPLKLHYCNKYLRMTIVKL